jgi:hypothetical protein
MKDMIGQCYFAGESYYGDQDYRTYIVGYTNASIVFGTDGNPDGVTSAAQFYGGQMFIASDATARVDCIVQNAGTTSHPLTGANSLVTTVAAYSSFQAVTLAAPNSQADISSAPQKIFVGSISVKPTYNRAVAAGLDAGLLPVVTIRKSATHVRVGYVPGGLGLTDIRATVQSHEQLVWEGEVELFGGPFIPKIYTGETSTVQVPMLQIDDREGSLRRPTMTMREAFGGLDPTLGANPFGGDSGHPSQLYLANVVDEVASAQNLAIPHHYHNTFGVSAPETGFCFTVPDHQVFTALTPSGTLATGTVTLPAVFSQGGRLELFSTQSITALTVTAPAGLGLAGLPATTIAANATIAYRLIDTTFCRVL